MANIELTEAAAVLAEQFGSRLEAGRDEGRRLSRSAPRAARHLHQGGYAPDRCAGARRNDSLDRTADQHRAARGASGRHRLMAARTGLIATVRGDNRWTIPPSSRRPIAG